MFAVLDDPVCDIDPDIQGMGQPVEASVLLAWPGLRVGVAQHGLVPSDENSRASLVIGQPEANDGRGRLGITSLVRANSSTGATYILQPPGLAPNDRFGASVAVADIRDCTPEGPGARGCGREILAGAPRHTDPAYGGGAVFWFQAQSVSVNLPEMELDVQVVEPVGSSPASIVLVFDVSTMPFGAVATAYPAYDLRECNTPPYGGLNVDGTFGSGVCE